MTNNIETQTPETIARNNAASASDLRSDEYPTRDAAFAAYLVNAIDTAREYRVSADDTALLYVKAYRRAIRNERKRR